MARLAPQHDTAITTKWKSTTWWHQVQEEMEQEDQRNCTGWRHPSRGTLKAKWDQMLCKLEGDQWWEKANDRQGWKLRERDYVKRAFAQYIIKQDEQVLDGAEPTLIHHGSASVIANEW